MIEPASLALVAAELELELQPDELAPGTILAGAPTVRSRELWRATDGSAEVGVWELTAGVVTDEEVDETFIVVAGRATVEIEGGPTLQLQPGTVGTLRAGDRTTWRVTETLRKVYVLHGPRA